MHVIVNGATRELPAAATVVNVVELMAGDRGGSLDATARGVAVAVEGEVVPRDEWSSTALAEGARVEVLAAIQGGAS